MNKYVTAAYPQDKYRFAIYINEKKLTWQQIKKEQGCFALCNLEYYEMATFTPCPGLIVGGMVIAKPEWLEYGVCIDANGRMSCDTHRSAAGQLNYGVAYPPMLYQGSKYASAHYFGNNGTTMVGFMPDGTPVALICSKDDGMTSTEAVHALKAEDCVTVLRYDGSWSSQGDLGKGKVVQPSQKRIVHSYLLVFERETKTEDKPMSKAYKVCLDPGHGVETPGKCAPDKSYYEHEFNLDLARRMRPILERHGVEVTLTRNTEKTLTGTATNAESYARVRIANQINGLDLFVSLHSNAAGNGGWYDARGLSCITSAAGGSAGRNRAAQAIIDRMREAGVLVRSTSLTHCIDYIVLRKTFAPAVIVEHGFHTSREDVALLKTAQYRDKLAVAECKGILDYLGIAWVEGDYKIKVQERFSLTDETMAYLAKYQYSDDLLKTLATEI